MSQNNEPGATSISPQAIIVICLVGAGVFLLCAWAIGRHFYYADSSESTSHQAAVSDGMTQVQHMRMVRLRNQEHLQRQFGFKSRPKSEIYSSYVSEV